MRLARIAIAVLLVVAAVGPRAVSAQAVDVSGTWQLAVTTDQGVTRPEVTFEQDGSALSGDYASETLGRHSVQGSVEGTTVQWSFSANMQGQTFPVRYEGTLQDDGTISGSIDIASGMMTGSFVATRDDG